MEKGPLAEEQSGVGLNVSLNYFLAVQMLCDMTMCGHHRKACQPVLAHIEAYVTFDACQN